MFSRTMVTKAQNLPIANFSQINQKITNLMFCTLNITTNSISKSVEVSSYQKYYSPNARAISNTNCSMKSADQQLTEITVARWMRNVYTFYNKSMAQKMALFS